jgi:hypothetical protein
MQFNLEFSSLCSEKEAWTRLYYMLDRVKERMQMLEKEGVAVDIQQLFTKDGTKEGLIELDIWENCIDE